MLFYALRRLMVGVIQVAFIAMTTFVVLRLLPVDAASVFAGVTADGASRAIVAQQLGLDKPLLAQLGSFVWDALHGTLGRGWVTQKPVLGEIASHIAITLQLVAAALVISVVLGTLIGYAIAAADSNRLQHRRQPLAAIGKGIVLASGSQPEFWWGLVFIALFFKVLGWSPPPFGVLSQGVVPPQAITGFIGIDALVQGNWVALKDFAAHIALPVATICVVLVGPIAKVVRESVLPVMASAYYANLRAQGAGRWRLLRCVLRNGGAPVVMLLGVLFGPIIGGTALVETIYSINGLSRLTVHSILGADFPMVAGCVATVGVLCVTGYLFADIVASWLNPNLRQGRSQPEA
jgi:ABC-type dipeptide/oligopeptide/nickel transport system permease component